MANIYQLSEMLQACIKLDEQRMVDTDTGEILDVDQYLDMAGHWIPSWKTLRSISRTSRLKQI